METKYYICDDCKYIYPESDIQKERETGTLICPSCFNGNVRELGENDCKECGRPYGECMCSLPLCPRCHSEVLEWNDYFSCYYCHHCNNYIDKEEVEETNEV